SQDPSTELEARMRGYIDVAIRASTESIMQNMQLYMDQQARTQQEWNRQLMETVNQKLAQFEQVNLNNNNQTISGEQLTTGQHPCNSRQ
ncbi:4603_t:CDS:1, partial [Gigaspora rosea]